MIYFCMSFFFFLIIHNKIGLAHDMENLKYRVKNIFYHAYDSYLKYAYPLDELRPLSCDGHDTWGSFSLTLIDALDTLVIMDNFTEFRRAARALLRHLNSEKNVNASVFETNIRVVGGLISAHLLSRRAGFEVEPSWPCSGALLSQAEIFANKLLPAFNTPTGMPYGTINFKLGGVPVNETTVTCVAGVGTFILEFGTLSRLTGDPRYEAAAMRALKAIWKHRSSLGLLGNHIDITTGSWTARDATIGSGVDSYFEYLVKGAALFRLPELDSMFREYRLAIEKHIRHGDWNPMINKDKGGVTMPVFQSLEAFWPGLLALTGDLDGARRHLTAYHEIWRQHGFLPELYSLTEEKAIKGREAYPLRPELIESILYVYRATRDPALIDMGVDILTSIEVAARTSCGFATVADVTKHTLEDRMESFFLAETTKYLYLLFDENNFMHQLPGERTLSEGSRLPSGLQCYPESGGYIFNTEAHPIDPGALDCCFAPQLDEVEQASKAKTLLSDPLQFKIFNDSESESDTDISSQHNAGPTTEIDLLSAVDSVFSEYVQSQLGYSLDDPLSWITNQSSFNCFNNAYLDSDLIITWMELREILDPSTSEIENGDKQQKFKLFDSIKPPLLTCPYPSFQNRFAFSGLLTST
ncbi:ER degradation-enhancing alpha-mannosidase-like protein isoform 1 [Schistosoma japonicum]|uniref:alpha-1,2-Mannosidase n=2 Tax=Schistosoma japonicum TaxID=6182 RepID=A0A4Z2DBR5_SCHJA|nr:ER degradation-enhancing alpha-mannosidase-like protein isoform 1 [Schistosoma japonicum]